MALSDQFLRQVRNDPFGTAIKLRRATLIQRCNLCNSHLPDDPLLIGPQTGRIGHFDFPWASRVTRSASASRSGNEMLTGDDTGPAQRCRRRLKIYAVTSAISFGVRIRLGIFGCEVVRKAVRAVVVIPGVFAISRNAGPISNLLGKRVGSTTWQALQASLAKA